MSLQQQEQFYEMMSLYRERGSKAASTSARVTEVTNGLLVSKPVKEPVVIDLQEYAKSRKGLSNAASASGINKLREINNFITSKRY